jgi:hypothetical protein
MKCKMFLVVAAVCLFIAAASVSMAQAKPAPFFPVGVWFEGQPQAADYPADPEGAQKYYDRCFKDLKAHGFNAVAVPNCPRDLWETLLASAQKNDIKVALEVGPLEAMVTRSPEPTDAEVEAAVSEMKNLIGKYSSLLSYQVCDEIGMNAVGPWLRVKRAIEKVDPEHPIFCCFNDSAVLNETTKRESLVQALYDIYPIYVGSKEQSIGDFMKALDFFTEASRTANQWQVLQSFAKPGVWRYPTSEELRSMTYLSLANGAKGMFYFLYQTMPKHWEKLEGLVDAAGKPTPCYTTATALAKEMKKLSPLLLSLKNDGKKLSINGDARVGSFTDSRGNRVLIVASTTPGSEVKARVQIEEKARWKDALTGESFTSENGTLEVPLGPGCGRVLVAKASKQQTAAKVSVKNGLPDQIVPECFGVNIHFDGDEDTQVKQIADAGFKFIRMDLAWHRIEKEKGKLDWSGHDGLMTALGRYGIRAVYIVDYGNPLYSGKPDERMAPSDDEYRKAYVNFARTAAKRYKGKGVIWEIWNEPNGAFWQPYSPENYVKAARAAAQAIKEEDPSATVIGPALAYSGHPFLDEIVKLGALEVFDAISVHPYRPNELSPETVMPDYKNLRNMFDAAAPKGKFLPIISGEWGYTTVNMSYEMQAQYIVRELLVNMLSGVKLSIWYDWHDDGTNPKEGEHNFGTVKWDFTPKPSYTAVQNMTRQLKGYRLVRRLKTPSENDFVLVFSDGKEYKLDAWTTGDAHPVSLKVDALAVTISEMLGNRKKGEIKDGNLNLTISKSP